MARVERYPAIGPSEPMKAMRSEPWKARSPQPESATPMRSRTFRVHPFRMCRAWPFRMASIPVTLRLRNRLAPFRYSAQKATWRSGYAAVCKTVYPGSIPGVASSFSLPRKFRRRRPSPEGRCAIARRERPGEAAGHPGTGKLCPFGAFKAGVALL